MTGVPKLITLKAPRAYETTQSFETGGNGGHLKRPKVERSLAMVPEAVE